MSTLLIRADGGGRIGTGHIMRTLALAQAWKRRGGDVAYVLAAYTPALLTRLESEDVTVRCIEPELGSQEDARAVIDLAGEYGCRFVVVDGYHFTTQYQNALNAAHLKQLLLDDNGDSGRYAAEFVLNQNIHADEVDYSARSPQTKLLLGCRFGLVRREFLAWKEVPRTIPDRARRILVTLGGSDPDNVTGELLAAIALVSEPGIEADVVVGGSNPHLEHLREQAGQVGAQIRVLHDVRNMPELMARADMGIIGGGSTYIEAALLGLPCVVVIIADNQAMIASRLKREGLAEGFGWFSENTPQQMADRIQTFMEDRSRRAEISCKLRILVDGSGADRAISALAEA